MPRTERQVAERAEEAAAALARERGAFLRMKKTRRFTLDRTFTRGSRDTGGRILKCGKKSRRQLTAASRALDRHSTGPASTLERERECASRTADRTRWRSVLDSHANKVCLP